ncbi:M48 family metallopeptidase [Histidinibacterium aquaticum]|uniref:M48 family metallopeptidase n=1 Tax=Histidinibacterium aquaticum TaxID=2613962 RepID=A0A5J5GQW5_9RHOB|nr:SprT family zinc-dependent metalloprotease [Histidinibacterium aquaticum]KAA9010465.1 M48 family metallopeptidase [Histidinibacterium aquaticum]
MGDTLRLGNPPISIALRRSARARRLSLRVSQLDGRVTLTLPRGVTQREGERFAREKETWLRGHLGRMGAPEPLEIGGTVPFEGRAHTLEAASVRAPRAEGERLLVPGDPDQLGRRVSAFFKLAARERLAEASDRHAAALGRRYGRITLRDTRSRWGSCSSEGNLMYSWRLIMAPREVLDYVALHEVAHLAEMNHGPRFWALVESRCPGWKAHRNWLRDNGPALHRVSFGA